MFLRILRGIGKGFLILFGLVAIYLLVAVLGTWISTGKKNNKEKGEITVFIQTNGFHTDWVVPIQSKEWNWLSHFSEKHQEKYQNYRYMAFGWGDEGFYTVSKTNKSQVLTALNAVFLPSKTVMHVDFLEEPPKTSKNVVELCISENQLKKLNKFIFKSFKQKKSQGFQFISNGYWNTDYFFKARGRYTMFFTCNNWTNRGLKKLKIPTGIWCPFSQSIFYHLK